VIFRSGSRRKNPASAAFAIPIAVPVNVVQPVGISGDR